MANFSTQIQALVGTVTESELDDWWAEGAKEIINILPPKLKEKCMTETTLNNSATTMDMDGVGEILYVNRLSADSGGSRIPCRKVPSVYGELSNDSNSLYKASETDPVYWILSSGDTSILNVIPTPTANQTAIVYHAGYPSIAYGDTSISNFPDEAEYLVPLRAAITAAEYQLAIEEDVEIYLPIISNLKQEYQQGVLALQSGSIVPPQQKGAK